MTASSKMIVFVQLIAESCAHRPPITRNERITMSHHASTIYHVQWMIVDHGAKNNKNNRARTSRSVT